MACWQAATGKSGPAMMVPSLWISSVDFNFLPDDSPPVTQRDWLIWVVAAQRVSKAEFLLFKARALPFFICAVCREPVVPQMVGKKKKNPKFLSLEICAPVLPQQQQNFGQVLDLRWKRKILSWELCAPVFPQQQQQNFHKSKIWTNNNNKRQSSCNKARALPFLFGQQQPWFCF